MVVEAALGENRRHRQRFDGKPERILPAQPLQRGGGGRGRRDQQEQRGDAPQPFSAIRAAIELVVRPADQPPHQHHRMRRAAPQPIRVAQGRIQQQREGQKQGGASCEQGHWRPADRGESGLRPSASASMAIGKAGPPQTISRPGRTTRRSGGRPRPGLGAGAAPSPDRWREPKGRTGPAHRPSL